MDLDRNPSIPPLSPNLAPSFSRKTLDRCAVDCQISSWPTYMNPQLKVGLGFPKRSLMLTRNPYLLAVLACLTLAVGAAFWLRQNHAPQAARNLPEPAPPAKAAVR